MGFASKAINAFAFNIAAQTHFRKGKGVEGFAPSISGLQPLALLLGYTPVK